MSEQLWRRWWGLMASCRVAEAGAQREFEQLVQAYGSGGRYYHTLAHIQQVLTTVAQLKPYARNLAIVELGAWFHDVVYDPQASHNEANSAEYATAAMRRLGLPGVWELPVRQLILATGSHLSDSQAANTPDAKTPDTKAPDVNSLDVSARDPGTLIDPNIQIDPDIQVLRDADLAILGSPPQEYAAYAQAIRQEYAWVSDDRYRQGRSRILQAFLQRRTLYFTSPMQALISQAHHNLKTEIQRLASL